MSRRGVIQRRAVPPDSVYNSRLISMTIRRIMRHGKKSLAARIVYDAMKIIEERTGGDPTEVFERAIRNLTPLNYFISSFAIETTTLENQSKHVRDKCYYSLT